MAKLSLEALKAQFKKSDANNEGGQNNYYPFWNMEVGEQAVIRFLPDANEDNPMGFLVEKIMHTLEINGEKKSVPCLKMYGEDCPICKVSAAFYKKDDKENGKKYWRKKQYIAQALIIEDPLPVDKETGENHQGKVRFIALGNKLYDAIKDAFESGDLEEIPFLYKGGTNFIIKKRQQGEYADYSRSMFAKYPSDLDDETIAHVESTIVDLSTLLPKNPGVEKIEAMLKAALTGTQYDENYKKEESHDDEDEEVIENVSSIKQVVKEVSRKTTLPKNVVDDIDDEPQESLEEAAPWEDDDLPVKSTKTTTKPQPSTTEDDEDDPEAILARLRARRNKN